MSGSIATGTGPYREMAEVVPEPKPYVEPAWKRLGVVLAVTAGLAANAGVTAGFALLNWPGPCVIFGLGALVSLVIGAIGMADADMAFKFCREWSTRKRVIAIGGGFLFLLSYAVYRVGRWVVKGAES